VKYVPHSYQSYATEFILKNPIAAILLQMGLGKSVITLTAIRELLDSGDVKKILVIAPLRVARDTWPEEIRKWDHLKELTFNVAVGSPEERRAALMAGSEVMIINRENVPWLIEQSGIPFRWDMVVIDELSSFKNWQAKRFRALMKVRPFVRRIVGLTGTPSPNGYMDLFAEYRVLDMGERLGRFIGRYREAYFIPDRWGNSQVFSWKLRPGADEAIYRKISDITVSMKSVDHLKMPECMINEVPVHMDERERKAYETLKEQLFLRVFQTPDGYVAEGGLEGDREALQVYEIDAKNASVLCGKLSQLANGAAYKNVREMRGRLSLGLNAAERRALRILLKRAGAYYEEILTDVWDVIDMLPSQDDRDLLTLRFIYMESPEETARELGVKLATVYSRQAKAVGRVQRILNVRERGETYERVV